MMHLHRAWLTACLIKFVSLLVLAMQKQVLVIALGASCDVSSACKLYSVYLKHPDVLYLALSLCWAGMRCQGVLNVQASWLVSMVGARVGAAAAQRALEVLCEDDPTLAAQAGNAHPGSAAEPSGGGPAEVAAAAGSADAGGAAAPNGAAEAPVQAATGACPVSAHAAQSGGVFSGHWELCGLCIGPPHSIVSCQIWQNS